MSVNTANTTSSRKLGRSGIPVSALGLGCWAIGGPFGSTEHPSGWGEVNDDESIRALHRGLDLGVNFFDTADVYGTGHSERVLGKALAGRRQQVVIATKFANTFDEATRQGTGQNTSPEYIVQACDASLRRLNTDYIDLYQFHWNDYPVEQAGEVRDTLEKLVAQGKIRSYGWSTDFTDRARFFAEAPNCVAIQYTMNVVEDAPEMVALCEELNLASILRGPLAMGLLTGKYTANTHLPKNDVRGEHSPDWMTYFKDGKPNPEWLKKLDALRQVLTSGGRTLAQGSLAWLWARSQQTIPIPGFKTVAQVEENCGAMHLGPLTAEQMKTIDGLLGR
jgi:aryl-alcohol dehydrogenase-like predicted oxidoreductase